MLQSGRAAAGRGPHRALPLLSLLLAGLAGAARAELPPWVYGQEQRQAPLKADIEVLTVQLAAQRQVRAQVRLLAITRQPLPPRLRPGQTIRVVYALPPVRPQGWVGPAPLPLLRPGQTLPAWLTPDPHDPALFHPAAEGRSFGPSLEQIREPAPLAPPQG